MQRALLFFKIGAWSSSSSRRRARERTIQYLRKRWTDLVFKSDNPRDFLGTDLRRSEDQSYLVLVERSMVLIELT